MDDLSDKINQLFSDPNSMQQIKDLAGMLSQSGFGQKNGQQGVPQNFSGNTSGNAQGSSGNMGGMNDMGGAANMGNTSGITGAGNMGGMNFSQMGMNNAQAQANANANPMPNIDPEMIMKLSSAMQMMNRPDPRVDLLMALKENLSDTRQKKVDDAIKILRLLSLMPVLQEEGIFNLLG